MAAEENLGRKVQLRDTLGLHVSHCSFYTASPNFHKPVFTSYLLRISLKDVLLVITLKTSLAVSVVLPQKVTNYSIYILQEFDFFSLYPWTIPKSLLLTFILLFDSYYST